MNEKKESRIIKEDIRDIAEEIKDISYKLNGKTVLIAGGCGFLGQYIISTLDYLNRNILKKPCKIIIIDNFISGLRGSIKESENIRVIEGDISKPINIEEPVDYIIHAASIASPIFYNKFRLETIDVGFLGTKNLLELARKKNIESFLFFSSSEIYGNPLPEFIPTNENYLGNVSCIGPRACYDEPKRIGETLCMTYAEIYNLPVKIVRPFNVFGPGMRFDDGRVIPNFTMAALNGEKIPLYGNGKNTRTFCYISNATVGWFKILLSDHNREVFNVGSDEQEIQMKPLAELILGLVENDKSKIHLTESPIEVYGVKKEPERRCPDLTKTRTMLGYNPKVNLIVGLKRFIEWVKEEFENEKGLYGSRIKCGSCGNENLKKVLSLGKTPLANSLLTREQLSQQEEVYPLEIVYCENCNLCQLSYVVHPEKMFKNYPYVTSTTETFKKHFTNMAKEITEEFGLGKGSLVVDIGSNDGLLLRGFKEKGIGVVGIEPAENICEIARKEGIDTICDFLNEDVVGNILKLKGKADVITGNNVFAHISDIKDVVKNVKSLLKEEGVFVIEVQYLLDNIKNLTFDNIYHEHLYYYGVLSLNEFFNKQEMEIFKVKHVDTHGGSLRVFVQKKGSKYAVDSSVDEMIRKEKEFGLYKIETYEKFAEKVYSIKEKLKEKLKEIKKQNKKIVGYGAPAKATTSLNFYGINKDYIDYIVEDNPLKHGLTVPGVRIPIASREELERNLPDYIVILAWNFAEEILRKNEALKEKGVKFIIPSPELKIV